jgi:PPM family protein phosphatase
MTLKTHCISDAGPRARNEDSWGSIQLPSGEMLLAIADGVGGKSGGNIASRLAIDGILSIRNSLINELVEKIQSIDQHIREQAQTNQSMHGMATTLSVLIVSTKGIFGAHVGDSRISLFRKNGVKQLTKDHTEVQRIFEEGLISKEDALNYPRKNILENALGSNKPLKIDTFQHDINLGDRLALTTDGVHDIISKRELLELSLLSETATQFCESTLAELKTRKITDNYTILAADIISLQ